MTALASDSMMAVMSNATNARWELTATKDADGIRSVMTTYHRTRRAAEEAAWSALGWGWSTTVNRTGAR